MEDAPAGLSLPFIPQPRVFAANAPAGPAGAASPAAAIRALPGLGAWSLDCRRKTLRGVLRAWLLNSRKSVR